MSTRKYDQRVRAEAAEETRRRILAAVYERLREAPSEPVSVDRVARMARVSRSTVYLIFGSRAGLFDALGADLLDRAGFADLMSSVSHADAREALRGGIRQRVRMHAAHRDVLRVLHSMAMLDSDAVGGTIGRMEEGRAAGMTYLSRRLAEQELLRPAVTAEDAEHLLWLLTSFDGFDLLYTGRGLSIDAIAELLITTAERSLYR